MIGCVYPCNGEKYTRRVGNKREESLPAGDLPDRGHLAIGSTRKKEQSSGGWDLPLGFFKVDEGKAQICSSLPLTGWKESVLSVPQVQGAGTVSFRRGKMGIIFVGGGVLRNSITGGVRPCFPQNKKE